MRHEVTSLNTKKLIASSLKKAMKTKPLSKITVSELIRDCGINRNTFYYHFDDIYDLLHWMFENELIDKVKKFNLITDSKKVMNLIMDYLEENEHILNCAYDSIGRDEMKRFFYEDFIAIVSPVIECAEEENHITLKPDFKQFVCKFYTEALAGMLIEWIKKRESRNREEVIQNISFILKSSINAILAQSPENNLGNFDLQQARG